ncbi:hypothetical protein [Luteococcus sp. OSA5]|uniref:hypothetical protein n=1 Tax=Luteococcus sp. OSA5 TaxID=3401630 RepID=UPI003B439AE9
MSGPLRSEVVAVGAVDERLRAQMLALMQLVYEGVDERAFHRDLADKDECILLWTPAGRLVGFSTQKVVHVELQGQRVEGLFSGDTVVHPDHWGSPDLFQAFARRYVVEEPSRWWFLVSKGHRTYRMMTLFFSDFYPDRRRPTPAWEQQVMDAYASQLFGAEHDAARGVLAYRAPKDRLRPEYVRREQTARHPDAVHFERLNPGYVEGHDLVCLARLSPSNLRPALRARLLGP